MVYHIFYTHYLNKGVLFLSKQKENNKKKGTIFGLIFLAIFSATLLGLLVFFKNNVEPIKVQGISMSPTLVTDEKLIGLKSKDYERGNIISFIAPDEEDTFYIKRLIAKSGDTLEYKNDELFINGEIVEEPYLEDLKNSDRTKGTLVTPDFNIESLDSTQSKTVPEGKLFVMGDNRSFSKDSRFFGFIDESSVIAKIVYPKK